MSSDRMKLDKESLKRLFPWLKDKDTENLVVEDKELPAQEDPATDDKSDQASADLSSPNEGQDLASADHGPQEKADMQASDAPENKPEVSSSKSTYVKTFDLDAKANRKIGPLVPLKGRQSQKLKNDLQPGVALVTGASAGLGWEFAQLLDEEDFVEEIWLLARREDRLDLLNKLISKPTRIIVCDLSSQENMEELRQLIEDEQPRLSCLVNSAGLGKIGEFGTLSLEEQAYQVELNIQSVLALTYMCLPYFNQGALIFNMASVASYLPQPEFATYAASKAFIRSWSLALANEKSIRDRKITVTTVHPNPMDTEFFKVAAKTEEDAKRIMRIGVENPRKCAEKALTRAKAGKNQSSSHPFTKLAHLSSRLLPLNLILWFERNILRLFK